MADLVLRYNPKGAFAMNDDGRCRPEGELSYGKTNICKV
ncbi:MAG: hypothetical protein METHSR3v1_640023 [Methanothrix sp.]|nr:MAG: hypothetical protein METHSR3v1_640023 [Methanothrix sp.]